MKALFAGGVFSLCVMFAGVARADAPTVGLDVSGDVPKVGKLTLKDLEGLHPEKKAWNEHGEKHEVEGVSLGKILAHQGFEAGIMGKGIAPAEKRAGYKKVVVATAKDGFQAVFSCAELSDNIGNTEALVIWKIDGKPVGADQGPLRIVVLSDKEPSRSMWSVEKIEVVDLRQKLSRKD